MASSDKIVLIIVMLELLAVSKTNLYYTVLYSIIQYYTVLYSIIQYYTVLYSFNEFYYYSDTERITTPQHIGARVVNGASDGSSGRLEVWYNSQWGNVCKSGWKYSNALVTCRQLGYSRYCSCYCVNLILFIQTVRSC